MDVTFQTQLGENFTIEIGYFDTVLEMKEKVEKYQGIPVSKQTLIFKGQVLPDDGDVASCVILHNSHMLLFVTPSKNDVIPQPIITSEPTKFNIDTCTLLEPSPPTISQVSQEKQPEYQQQPIQNHESVGNLRSSPILSGSFSGGGGTGSSMGGGFKKIWLSVMTSCGKIPIEVYQGDNVGELRKELEKIQQRVKFQLSKEGYFFICNQNVMEENRSFRWNHVSEGDTIEIFNGSVSGGQ